MIRQRTLGRTCLKVSELCLGTMNFGWRTGEQKSLAILDAYYAAGGNFIQATGHCPAPLISAASTVFSEEIVGRWWHSRAIPRNRIVLATRLGLGRVPDGVSLVEFARDCVHASLRRLKTDYLDLVVFEWNESLLSGSAIMEVFDMLVRSGLVRYLGAANFPVWRVVDIMGRARLGGHSRMEMLQADYSLMTRARFEPEAMALCREQRFGFLARSPLAGGFLARSNGVGDHFSSSRRDWLEQRYGNPYGDAALAAVDEVAARHDAMPAQIALSWVLHNPAVTSAIIGVHSPEQLGELLAAGEIQLSGSDLASLADATSVETVRIASSHAGALGTEVL
ncbi:aldo/keto reductase [Opitutaceae bacterium]